LCRCTHIIYYVVHHDPKLGEIRFSHSIIIFAPWAPQTILSILYLYYPLIYALSCTSGAVMHVKRNHRLNTGTSFCSKCVPPTHPKKMKTREYSGRRTHRYRHRPIYQHTNATRLRMYFIGMQIRRRGLFFFVFGRLILPHQICLWHYDIIYGQVRFVFQFLSCTIFTISWPFTTQFSSLPQP